jgi:hypothetical protein
MTQPEAVTASRRNVRFPPAAFTEYGIGMLSGFSRVLAPFK